MISPKRILISRTDSIGDVILSLPMSGVLKSKFTNCEIVFLGRTYTRDVVLCSTNVDRFIDYSEIEKLPWSEQVKSIKDIQADVIIHAFPKKEIAKLAKSAGIKFRIGTSHRWYNLIYCNKTISFSRKKSELHESQLNLKLLKPFQINISDFSLKKLAECIDFKVEKSDDALVDSFIQPTKFNIILHPKSKGSAREWNLENFQNLIRLLPPEKYHFILTGTEPEGLIYRTELCKSDLKNVSDSSGKLSLKQLIQLISKADALIACSTGPLHIASVCNINAIGIFPPIKPMHPGRWSPIGDKVKVFCKDIICSKCKNNSDCTCINEITTEEIISHIVSINDKS